MTQTEGKQQTIVDGEPYVATISAVDLEELAAALEPVETSIYLDFDHDQLEVRAVDFVNVYATRVRKPIDAPHATLVTVDSEDLIEAVDASKWAEDDVRLEVKDDEIWIFDGDENRYTYQEVERVEPEGARDRPQFEAMCEELEWNVHTTCDAWKFAGAARTVAEPARMAVRIRAEDFGVRVEGDDQEFDDEVEKMVQAWPYFDRFDADVEVKPENRDDGTCVVSEDYLQTLVDAVPVTGEITLELRFGHGQPFYAASDSGVEVVIAPRRTGDDDD